MSPSRAAPLPESFRVAVVGAGISGLACASTLKARGAHVVVFEASRRPGGRAATEITPAGSFDQGAQFFTAQSSDFESLGVGVVRRTRRRALDRAGDRARRRTHARQDGVGQALHRARRHAGARPETRREPRRAARHDGGLGDPAGRFVAVVRYEGAEPVARRPRRGGDRRARRRPTCSSAAPDLAQRAKADRLAAVLGRRCSPSSPPAASSSAAPSSTTIRRSAGSPARSRSSRRRPVRASAGCCTRRPGGPRCT